MKNYKFEVGDMIKILDGHEIKDYAGGWCPDDMNHLIGKTYKIFDICDPKDRGERVHYRIRDEKGDPWSIDARGAEKVEKNKSIYKFEVGDMIKILDGHEIKDYAGGWYPDDMNHLIGKTYKIFDICDPKYRGERVHYRIRDEKGDPWSIDARGAEKVEKNKSIYIFEHISKKGRRVVNAWQDDVVGSAVCHPEDEFDYYYGIELALKRLREAQAREAKKEAIAKKNAEIEALMENNYTAKGFMI